MNGYGSHTFKLVDANGKAVYCKFHYKTDQGIKNLSVEDAARLAHEDPDYGLRDLFNAIATGNYPSWTFYIQVMTFNQAETFPFNPFDITKVWPHNDYPLIPVGKLVLNRNPVNYFAEVEQLAFDPSNMPPGIEPSPDKMLQGRLFAYPDTHRHRLGPNYLQIPVNCPFRARVASYQRDGPMCVLDNQGGAPNYYPNSFGASEQQPSALEHRTHCSGDVQRFNSANDDNVTQGGEVWRAFKEEGLEQELEDGIVPKSPGIGTHQAECLKPDQPSRRKVLEGLQYPFAVTSFGKNLYYTDWKTNSVVAVDLAISKETDSFHPHKQTRLYGITTALSQCPEGHNYCSVNNGGCTHLCLATPGSRTCRCPDNTLGVDCIERK
ncbi:Catalase, partial [Eschrichtius robustus]|nr:Catalase [Eschrichtius robustus]